MATLAWLISCKVESVLDTQKLSSFSMLYLSSAFLGFVSDASILWVSVLIHIWCSRYSSAQAAQAGDSPAKLLTSQCTSNIPPKSNKMGNPMGHIVERVKEEVSNDTDAVEVDCEVIYTS